MSWLHATKARLRLLFARRLSESRMNTEFQFHIEMETKRLARELALEPKEARRRALITFGGMQQHREELRRTRGAAWLGGLSLDFKLGFRMLAKHPGLTLLAVLGISVAVIIGALAFTAVSAFTLTALPLHEGDRVVAIENVDTKGQSDQSRTHLHDLAVWRETLRAVEDLGAYRTVARNFIAADAPPAAVRVAEMTASGFHLARVAPTRGRYLTDEDELEGAPAVIVIGYDLWQQKLGGRTDVVGSTVQLGTLRHTVVGVMPRGFAFPVNNEVWTPLRLSPTAYQYGEAPAINIFARLAPGASLALARQELTAIGERLDAQYAGSRDHIRPQVLPYTRAFFDGLQLGWLLHLGQVVVSLLLVVIATNVGVLVYARTASRAGEMAVRTALGASRRRVVTQLFAEALVLSGLASVVGIIIAHTVFQRVEAMVVLWTGDYLPYWMRLDITPGVVVYVAGLAVLAAVIIGVIPGIKATHPGVSGNLKDLSGISSMRLGRTWTALLVAQVAVSVAALPIALGGGKQWVHLALLDRGTAATESFVITTPLLDVQECCVGQPAEDANARRLRYTNRMAQFAETLEGEPGGFEVVFMSSAPGAESDMPIELDLISTPPRSDSAAIARAAGSIGMGRVEAEFFTAFGIHVLAGRSFTAADFTPGASAAIVNRSFVQRFLQGGNALGQRLRHAPQSAEAMPSAKAGTEPWREIVGVVEDFPAPETHGALKPKVYLPLRPAGVYPMTVAVRAATLTPSATADRVRMVGMSIDPTLRFATIRPLEDLLNDEIEVERLLILGLVTVALSVVLLSAAGIYALMSFTVARRQREIGIRTALGARKGRVLAEILSRAMGQIGIGIGIGVVGSGILARVAGDSSPLRELVVQLVQVTVMMVVVGLIAAIGPARRALRIEPTEALRTE